MGAFNRKDFLVTYGDKPVKAAGEQVKLQSKGIGDTSQQMLDVEGGEILVWDPTLADGMGETIASGDIATANTVRVSVGIDTNGDGMANFLQDIGGDGVDFRKGKVTQNLATPSCGLPQIKDVYFDCTQAESVYSFLVRVDDYYTRSRYNYNQGPEYVFSSETELPACDDCDTPHDCQKLAQDIVDKVNGKALEGPVTYFMLQELTNRYQPFSAGLVRDNSFDFCLTYDEATCDKSCAQFTGIEGIKIDTVITTFDYTTLPSDSTKSVDGQLDRILAEINEALPEGDHATLIDSTGDCCDHRIQILSNAADIQLRSNGGDVAPCDTGTPLADQGATCGVRFYGHPVEYICESDGLPPNETTPSTFLRTIDVEAIGEGFAKDGFTVVDVQDPTLPEGLGYFWKNRQWKQQKGGGDYMRNFRRSMKKVGTMGLPSDASSPRSTTVKCNEKYRTWSVTHETAGTQGLNGSGMVHRFRHLATVLVPESDTTTHASLQPYIDALEAASGIQEV